MHALACGQSIKATNIDKLINYANKELADVNFNEGYWEVDFIVDGNCSYLNNLIEELSNGKEFWGQGNPEATIAVENIAIDTKDIMYRGAEKNTVAFSFNGIEYIKFKDDNLVDLFREHNGKINLTVVGTPQVNEWGGRKTNQIQIKEIEIKDIDEYSF